MASTKATRKQRKRLKRKGNSKFELPGVISGVIKGKKAEKHLKIELKNKAKKEQILHGFGSVTPLVEKYWCQRYDLFSKYDEGIRMDEEGWFSVTPEEIAASQAKRCAGAGVVIDAFTGVGGNAIQFALVCYHVIAIDIDPKKVALAYHNAKIYGVEDKIEFVVGDFFKLAPSLKKMVMYSPQLFTRVQDLLDRNTGLIVLEFTTSTSTKSIALKHIIPELDRHFGDDVIFIRLSAGKFKGDVVFLSPPWGGPSYKAKDSYTLDLLKPEDGHSLFQVAQSITENIIMFLPRNIDLLQASELSWLSSPPLDTEVEENFVRGYSKGITIYFGDVASA
ncbi:hypothetical protein OROGR_014373 [Orobanche gracilis]